MKRSDSSLPAFPSPAPPWPSWTPALRGVRPEPTAGLALDRRWQTPGGPDSHRTLIQALATLPDLTQPGPIRPDGHTFPRTGLYSPAPGRRVARCGGVAAWRGAYGVPTVRHSREAASVRGGRRRWAARGALGVALCKCCVPRAGPRQPQHQPPGSQRRAGRDEIGAAPWRCPGRGGPAAHPSAPSPRLASRAAQGAARTRPSKARLARGRQTW